MFSIIIPTKDRQALEKRAIESVLAQTYKDWELLISDASGDDHLLDYVRTLKEDPIGRYDIKYYHSRELPHVRRRQLTEVAQGEILAYLDSDDYWLPQKLKEHHQVHQEHPEVGLTWDHFKNIDHGQLAKNQAPQPLISGIHQPPRIFTVMTQNLWNPFFLHMSSLVAKKSAVMATGGFPNTPFCDGYLAGQIGRQYPVYYLDKLLTYVDISAQKRLSNQRWPRPEYWWVGLRVTFRYPKVLLPGLYRYFFTHGRKAYLTKHLPFIKREIRSSNSETLNGTN